MTRYAHPGPVKIPGWKRCKVRHSPQIPARCKLPRGHEGDCRFGTYKAGPHRYVDLDQPKPAPVTVQQETPPPPSAPTGDR